MRTKPAYLVVRDNGVLSKATIVRVSQNWPTLKPYERAVRIQLDLDDEAFPTHSIAVDPDSIIEATLVAADPPEYVEDDTP